MIDGLTPILHVDAIEPILPFWRDRLGFQVVNEVREDDRLGFVILVRGDLQLMAQTRESVENDLHGIPGIPPGGTILFLQVPDLDAIIEALGDTEVLVPRRTTFYGSEEIWVREPGGNVVGFAEFGDTGGTDDDG